jgi:hypothetical protein
VTPPSKLPFSTIPTYFRQEITFRIPNSNHCQQKKTDREFGHYRKLAQLSIFLTSRVLISFEFRHFKQVISRKLWSNFSLKKNPLKSYFQVNKLLIFAGIFSKRNHLWMPCHKYESEDSCQWSGFSSYIGKLPTGK